MVAGHPFKGGVMMSTGQIEHPDLKRFELNDATLFVPPRPDASAYNLAAGLVASSPPAFGDYFATYFAGKSFNVTNPKCTLMLEGMKKCYENHEKKFDPVEACQYYIQGFERLSCN